VPPVVGELVWVRKAAPGDFSTGIPRSISPTVTFGRDIDPLSIAGTSVWLRNGVAGNKATVTLSYDVATKMITIDPTPPAITSNTPYIVYITGLKDTDGNDMPGLYTFRFTTGSV
jgi:hypothetical protein